MVGIIMVLLSGGIAGWLAGKLMNREGSVIRNILLGLAGGVVGDIVLGFVGIHGSGFIGGIIVSVVGACILIWVAGKLRG